MFFPETAFYKILSNGLDIIHRSPEYLDAILSDWPPSVRADFRDWLKKTKLPILISPSKNYAVFPYIGILLGEEASVPNREVLGQYGGYEPYNYRMDMLPPESSAMLYEGIDLGPSAAREIPMAITTLVMPSRHTYIIRAACGRRLNTVLLHGVLKYLITSNIAALNGLGYQEIGFRSKPHELSLQDSPPEHAQVRDIIVEGSVMQKMPGIPALVVRDVQTALTVDDVNITLNVELPEQNT